MIDATKRISGLFVELLMGAKRFGLLGLSSTGYVQRAEWTMVY
jgi:hypothetical protein